MSEENDEENDNVENDNVKSNKQVHKSINAVWYFIILVLFLALIALIIAIVAMFYPKNNIQSTYNKVVNISLNAFSGDKTAFAGSSVTLPLDNIQGTLYIINSSTTTKNPILPPVVINGLNIQGNSNFSIFNTNNNTVYLLFNNFNNMQNSLPVILNSNNNYVNCYVDNNFNLYYQFNMSYPYYNGSGTQYNSKITFTLGKYQVNNSPTSPTVLYMINVPSSGGLSKNIVYKNSFLEFDGNSTPNTPGYLFFDTDNLTSSTSGVNYLINNTVNTIYYTYGTTAAYNTIINSTTPSPASYYIYNILPGKSVNIIYENGKLVYPILPTTSSSTLSDVSAIIPTTS